MMQMKMPFLFDLFNQKRYPPNGGQRLPLNLLQLNPK
jgi:hypothetical protein